MFTIDSTTIALISIAVSILGTIISILISVINIRYAAKNYDLDRQQLALDQKQFLEEITRQGPMIQIVSCDSEYVLKELTSDLNDHSTNFILKGFFKGINTGTFLGTQTRFGVSSDWDNVEIGLTGIRVVVALTISNPSDLPIQIDKLYLQCKMASQIKPFWRKLLKKSLGGFEHSVTHRYDITEGRYTKTWFRGFYTEKRDRIDRFREYCDLCQALGNMYFINVEVFDQLASMTVPLRNHIDVAPKTKIRWKITMNVAQPAAIFLATTGSQIKPVEIELTALWEGQHITKKAQPTHWYASEDGGHFYDMDSVRIVP